MLLLLFRPEMRAKKILKSDLESRLQIPAKTN